MCWQVSSTHPQQVQIHSVMILLIQISAVTHQFQTVQRAKSVFHKCITAQKIQDFIGAVSATKTSHIFSDQFHV